MLLRRQQRVHSFSSTLQPLQQRLQTCFSTATTTTTTVKVNTKQVIQMLTTRGVPDALESALYLIQHARGGNFRARFQWLEHPTVDMSPEQHNTFQALLARRLLREPIQYIIGTWDFAHLDNIIVRAPVLIPRPETEELCSWIMESAAAAAGSQGFRRILDVGTGTGVIGLELLKMWPNARCMGIDVLDDAYRLSMENATRLGLSDRYECKLASFDTLEAPSLVEKELFDVIVSNPPYLPTHELRTLQPEIQHYESETALCSGIHGNDVITSIIERCGEFCPVERINVFLETGGTAEQRDVINNLCEAKNLRTMWKTDFRGVMRFVHVF